MEFHMQYMLMFYESADDFTKRGGPAAGDYYAGWMAYIGALRQSGVVINGDGLQGPPTATTVRLRGDKRLVQDGPFADAKEQLGGYLVIEAADLDAALACAARAPCATSGGVEVRPVMMAGPNMPAA
jgi:hypothetical protein